MAFCEKMFVLMNTCRQFKCIKLLTGVSLAQCTSKFNRSLVAWRVAYLTVPLRVCTELD